MHGPFAPRFQIERVGHWWPEDHSPVGLYVCLTDDFLRFPPCIYCIVAVTGLAEQVLEQLFRVLRCAGLRD